MAVLELRGGGANVASGQGQRWASLRLAKGCEGTERAGNGLVREREGAWLGLAVKREGQLGSVRLLLTRACCIWGRVRGRGRSTGSTGHSMISRLQLVHDPKA